MKHNKQEQTFNNKASFFKLELQNEWKRLC